MDFDVQIVQSVQEIGQEAWDRLGGGRAFTSYRWYRFGEAVLSDDTPVYIILSHRGEAVARATFWLTRQEALSTISSKIIRGLVQAVIRHWPLLVCRSPLSTTSGLILPDPPLREVALKTIAQVAQEQARRYRASFSIFDYLENHQAEGMAWPDPFVPTMAPDPGTRLAITWPDFESYVRDLSKQMRKSYKRHCRLADELGVVVTPSPRVATPLDEAMVLIRNVERRYNSPPEPWTRRVLEHAHMVDATWMTAEIDGRLVGCELILGDGNTRFLTALGLDYSVQYVYFRLGYADIYCAIEAGIQVLRAGSGAYDVKRRLGFELEYNNYLVFTMNNPAFRWLGRRLAAN